MMAAVFINVAITADIIICAHAGAGKHIGTLSTTLELFSKVVPTNPAFNFRGFDPCLDFMDGLHHERSFDDVYEGIYSRLLPQALPWTAGQMGFIHLVGHQYVRTMLYKLCNF